MVLVNEKKEKETKNEDNGYRNDQGTEQKGQEIEMGGGNKEHMLGTRADRIGNNIGI